ncbi:UNVERIFIED_CONTAM: hypothetical protein K2H54_057819 [Gekko kuhli]
MGNIGEIKHIFILPICFRKDVQQNCLRKECLAGVRYQQFKVLKAFNLMQKILEDRLGEAHGVSLLHLVS